MTGKIYVVKNGNHVEVVYDRDEAIAKLGCISYDLDDYGVLSLYRNEFIRVPADEVEFRFFADEYEGEQENCRLVVNKPGEMFPDYYVVYYGDEINEFLANVVNYGEAC